MQPESNCILNFYLLLQENRNALGCEDAADSPADAEIKHSTLRSPLSQVHTQKRGNSCLEDYVLPIILNGN